MRVKTTMTSGRKVIGPCGESCCTVKFYLNGFAPEKICKHCDQSNSVLESGGIYGMSPTVNIDCTNKKVIEPIVKEAERVRNYTDEDRIGIILSFIKRLRLVNITRKCKRYRHKIDGDTLNYVVCVDCLESYKKYIDHLEETLKTPVNWELFGALIGVLDENDLLYDFINENRGCLTCYKDDWSLNFKFIDPSQLLYSVGYFCDKRAAMVWEWMEGEMKKIDKEIFELLKARGKYRPTGDKLVLKRRER